MARQFSYFTFDNKVPKALQKLGCDPFDLKVCKEKGNGPRCLVIVGHVSKHDLQAGMLLSNAEDRKAISKIFDSARSYAKRAGAESVPNYQLDFINYSYFRTYHLKSEQRAAAEAEQLQRVQRYIEKTEPDVILFMGDNVSRQFLGNPIHHGLRRTLKVGDRKIKAWCTLELDTVTYEPDTDKGEKYELAKTNQIGYVVQNIANLFAGHHLFSIRHVKPNPVLVKTVKQFDKLYAKWLDAPFLGVDTETDGLSVHTTQLLTIQIATDSNTGYVIALGHKDNPMGASDTKYVVGKMRELFSRKRRSWDKWEEEPFLVMQGGQFDLRILRKCLGLPFIYTPLYDTLSGEFCLDENLTELPAHSTMDGSLGLDKICARYDNTYYYEAEFGKAHRVTIKDTDLNDCIEYCAADVQFLIAIMEQQARKAKLMEHLGGNYLHAFQRLQRVQMSAMIHQISSMKLRGVPIDLNYLMYLRSNASPLLKQIEIEQEKLKDLPSVRKANKKLLGDKGAPTTGLFGQTRSWLFKISKPDHKRTLYLDILKLKPVSFGKDGKTPSFDKNFQKVYKDVVEVAILTKIGKIEKLFTSYAKSIYNKAKNDADVKTDGRVRPNFGYLLITGRTNCTDPNLQQIPEHGELAKYIKRLFAATPGTLRIKFDFSVHEVRVWGIESKDSLLLKTFNTIGLLLKAFRSKRKVNDEDRERLETEGDMHKLNYSAFSGTPLKKITKEQRQSSKAITFGAIYGKGVAALAKDLGIAKEAAQKIINAFFGKFIRAKKWLDRMAAQIVEKGYAESSFGRRRNIYGPMFGFARLINSAARRAQNAPIQGMAADVAMLVARMIEEEVTLFLERTKDTQPNDFQPSAGVGVMVHDSTEAEAKYKHILVLLWIMEWCATKGARKVILDVYGKETGVDFAIDFAIGSLGSKMRKWDWTSKGLKKIITEGIEDQRTELGHDVDVERTVNTMYEKTMKWVPYLQKRYPLDHPPVKLQ